MTQQWFLQGKHQTQNKNTFDKLEKKKKKTLHHVPECFRYNTVKTRAVHRKQKPNHKINEN